MKRWTVRIVSVGLAAAILGLVIAPLPFVYFGVGFDFSPDFIAITFPPLFVSIGFLLSRFLVKANAGVGSRCWCQLLAGLSWLVIGAFLYIASGIGLTVGFERVGFVCSVFLATWALCLPLVALRPSALEQSIAQLPKAVSLAMLIITLVGASIASIIDAVTPPRFPGGLKEPVEIG